MNKNVDAYNTEVNRLEPLLREILQNRIDTTVIRIDENYDSYYEGICGRVRFLFTELITSRTILESLAEFDIGRKGALTIARNQDEELLVVNALNEVRNNADLLRHLRNLQSRVILMHDQKETVHNSVCGAIEEITTKTYNTKRRCCPTILNLIDRYLL